MLAPYGQSVSRALQIAICICICICTGQGYRPTVFYPKPSTGRAVNAILATQCEKADIPSLMYLPSDAQLVADSYSLVVDAIFGVGYEPPMSSDFAAIVQTITRSKATVVSIDVPSGTVHCLALKPRFHQIHVAKYKF